VEPVDTIASVRALQSRTNRSRSFFHASRRYRLTHSSSVQKFEMISGHKVLALVLKIKMNYNVFIVVLLPFSTKKQMVSASTDGWVKIWDTHMFVCVQVIADDAAAVADIVIGILIPCEQAFNVLDNPHMSLFVAGGGSGGGTALKHSIITELAYSSHCQRLFVVAKGNLLFYDVQQQVRFNNILSDA
jgi:hypothetical protein